LIADIFASFAFRLRHESLLLGAMRRVDYLPSFRLLISLIFMITPFSPRFIYASFAVMANISFTRYAATPLFTLDFLIFR